MMKIGVHQIFAIEIQDEFDYGEDHYDDYNACTIDECVPSVCCISIYIICDDYNVCSFDSVGLLKDVETETMKIFFYYEIL